LSRQLAISSVLSILAMAAFALSADRFDRDLRPSLDSGTAYVIAAPLLMEQARRHLLLPFEIG
jgi:hypothetical protein